jgi:4-diphosphocytidyl-2-C-methyl-D-erythritol kinase
LSATVSENAAAKINLALAVTGRRPDGYHLLDSYVVFADIGDRLRAAPAVDLSLAIDGPFAEGLDAGPENLALKAARKLADEAGRLGRSVGGAHLELTKMLPVAAGLGGGSADAAAVLRALNRLWKLDLTLPQLAQIGAPLGADVAMCIYSRALRARGAGEIVDPIGELPPLPMVLANPRRMLATADVFAALHRPASRPLPDLAAAGDVTGLVAWLDATENDLEGPARTLEPEIGRVLGALRSCAGCLLARMSGSGPTCFAIFSGVPSAKQAAATLSANHPGWWIAATMAR